MTEQEILKALDICNARYSEYKCVDCPLYDTEGNCKTALIAVASNYIKCLNIHIEKLKEQYNASQYLLLKEFAEKLKKKISTTTISGGGKTYFKKEYILPEAVDNLVEEMCK